MSTVNINGALILDGNLTCDGDININAPGVLYPVAEEQPGSYYSCDLGDYIATNGKSRAIKTISGDIIVDGLIDGKGRGFAVNEGPGANSLLESNIGQIKGFGGTHAGLGSAEPRPGEVLPAPLPRYGSHQAPVSIGSGSWATYGGSGVKIEARNGLVLINGLVTVDGGSGGLGQETGGGAGGSIWIIGWCVDGSGSLSAEGGETQYVYGGGGGGGYISIWYHNSCFSSLGFSIEGKQGGTPGKTFFRRIEPSFEDRFTGTVLNTKWWNVIEPEVSVDNVIKLDATTGYTGVPQVISEFTVQGQNLKLDLDLVPRTMEPDFYNADFLLYLDDLNWVGVGRRPGQMFASYSVDGLVSQFGITESYKPLTMRIYKTDSTFNFQYYDTTSSIHNIHTDVIPQFADEEFNVQLKVDRDLSIEGRILDQIKLTQFDIDNKYVSLSGYPTDPEGVSLSVVEGSYQFYGLDFYVAGAKLKWDAVGLLNFPSPYDFFFTEHFTLTAADIANQFVTLPKPPEYSDLVVVPHRTAVNVVGGTTLEYGKDYYIYNELLLAWSNSPIAHLLKPGDVIRVQFQLSPWYNPENLEDILQPGDILRIQYEAEDALDAVGVDFDNFRVFEIGRAHV